MVRVRIEVHRHAERWAVTWCSVAIRGQIHMLHQTDDVYETKQGAVDEMVHRARAKLAEKQWSETDEIIVWEVR